MRLTCLYLSLLLLGPALSSVRHAAADERFSLVIDPFAGNASLRNDGSATVGLDSYLLQAGNTPVLDPSSWNSLADQSTPDFVETSTRGGRQIGELSLLGSLSVSPGELVPIGSPYVPFSPSAFGEEVPGARSLNFTYSTLTSDGALRGDVEFSAINSVVLEVNPNTGAASLVNQSGFNIALDSYLITSTSDVLNTAGWSPLATSQSGWTASSGKADRLFEGNLLGSTPLLAGGGSLSLGIPINPALIDDETDISLAITVLGSDAIRGGVLFTEALTVAGIPGDFNNNGVVDLADYTVWRDNLGASAETALSGNGDGVGGVDVGDYQLWKNSFSSSAASAALSPSVASAAVPEPASLLMFLTGMVAVAALCNRCR